MGTLGEWRSLAYYTTRIVSCLVQVLYALNETYFISVKRMYKDEEKFDIKPKSFSARVNSIFGAIGRNRKELDETLQAAEALVGEVITLCGNQYQEVLWFHHKSEGTISTTIKRLGQRRRMVGARGVVWGGVGPCAAKHRRRRLPW